MYMEVPINESSDIWKISMVNCFQNLIDVTEDLPGYDQLNKKLKLIENTVFEKICAAAARDDNQFNVLCHGDMWANNIMFKHDEHGRVKDELFVDFQLPYWNSPVMDVMYNLYTSSGEDLCENDWNQLIKHYHEELSLVLKALKYKKPIPSLADLQEAIRKKSICAALIGVLCLGIRNLENVSDDGFQMFIRTGDEDRKNRLNMVMPLKCRKSLEFIVNNIDRNVKLDY